MALSNVSIVNSALASIGEDPISSLTQNNRAARVANRIFETQRDRTLMRYRWVFAMKRANLASDPTAPVFGFSKRYLIPSDMLQLVSVWEDGQDGRQYTDGKEPYKREGQYILTDMGSPLPIVYVRRVTDPAEFDPAFAEVLSFQLAIKLAPTLTNSAASDDLKSQMSEALRQARFAHAIQSTPEIIVSSEWLDSRFRDAGVSGPWRTGPVV